MKSASTAQACFSPPVPSETYLVVKLKHSSPCRLMMGKMIKKTRDVTCQSDEEEQLHVSSMTL